MRSTKQSLLISGGFAVGGSAMVAAGATLFETQGETLLTGSLIFIGLMIAPISIIWFLSSLVSGARKEALETGKGAIARWTVTAAEWTAFRAQESRMTAQGGQVNLLNFRSGQARDGEVVFAGRGVIADEDYHDLTPGGLIDLLGVEYVQGSPSFLDFAMRAQKGRGSSGAGFGFNYMWLRVPIASGEAREAMKVLQHYKRTTKRAPAIAMRNPALTIKVCFSVGAVCAIAAIWGFANAQSDNLGDAPLYAAVIGVITGIGALILAAIVFYRVRVLK